MGGQVDSEKDSQEVPLFLFLFLDPNVPILDHRLNLDMNLSEWNFFLEICFDRWFCKEHTEMER